MKCGVGDYTGRLAQALAQLPDTSVAVLTDAAAAPVPSEFSFEVFGVARGWRMTDAIRIMKFARHWRPDLVHIQFPTRGYGHSYLPWFLPAFFSIAKVPVVQTWHEHHIIGAKWNLLNAALGGGLIAVRPEYKSKMPGWYRWLIRKKHFAFIPNGSVIPATTLTENERTAIRSRFVTSPTRLVVYFGFAFAPKRVELLFDIADSTQDHLVLICDLDPQNEYQRSVLDSTSRPPWLGKVTVTGFLEAEQVGKLLAAADAVVLPFRDGGGEWNTSIRAAVAQGMFVLTTSHEKHGYDPSVNTYFARPDDVADMRHALRKFIGTRTIEQNGCPASDWQAIAVAHQLLYEKVVGSS